MTDSKYTFHAQLTTQAAVEKVLKDREISKYRMAQDLDVGGIMINHYLDGTRMRHATAKKFFAKYGVEITDVYGSKE